MLIQCTKKLLDKIGVKDNELASRGNNEQFPESFNAWHANIVTFNRKKVIILMNNETKYPIVIYRPLKKDFNNIKTLILEAIAEALRIEGVSQTVVDAYIMENKEVSFSKTANPRLVGRLNTTIYDVEAMQEYIDEKTKIQKQISLVSGRMITTFGSKHDYGYPIEKTLKSLELIYQLDKKSILDIDLYQLKIKLNLEKHSVWRRVLVPSTYSFRQLHNIVQTVFDWQESHLHDFIVIREDDKPLNIIIDDSPELSDLLDYEMYDIRQERFVILEDVFSKFTEVIYLYDLGDSWEHMITFEKIVKSKELEAKILDGEGERPPEDVGGSGGFEEYLRIMANEQDPSYEDMKLWAEGQAERKFSHEKINKRLKKVIMGYSTLVM